MYIKEDNTYNNIRERSLMQWLDEMESHEDVAVRSGVRLCRAYLQYLKAKNEELEKDKALRDFYLKKLSKK